MSYTAAQVIIEAFYESSIVSRGFQTVQGDQFGVGLIKLNEILNDTRIDTAMIPYYNTGYNGFFTAGVEQYFIPNLTNLETLTFFIDTIRYQMRKNPRDSYFGAGRAQNVESLPFNWHAERCLGGMNLFIYFFPDTNYPFQITGLFALQSVTQFQDLTGNTTVANLGTPTFFIVVPSTTYTILPGQLVVNGIDLQGTYAYTNQAQGLIPLVLYINTGIIPNVTAGIVGTQLVLTGNAGQMITVTTLGTSGFTNSVTFGNFSTQNGPFSTGFMPIGLDQYYINYLQYRLAARLCNTYAMEIPKGVQQELDRYELLISKNSSPLDMSMNKISTMTNKSSINYAQVNLGKGWTI